MVDQLDHKIIEILNKNSRASFVDIGKQIGLSPSSIRERIQKLEETEVILGYGLKINPKKLGYSLEVLILFKLYSGKLKLFVDQLDQFPEIQEGYRITGGFNICMQVLLEDQLHLQLFIDRLLQFGEPTTHLILSEL
ncbi:Lrp/AsnC family transcriptional regulator [Sediminicola arcticus]|jgi:Lrp/AsnC family leucine-responsive transcriptional regulator|uniref:Lrp/AsnC family transcriptional regulator n=1 Tax=Sediminicola arcticus TaxID=1574308 RepID=A0ABV2SV50_9FLAO